MWCHFLSFFPANAVFLPSKWLQVYEDDVVVSVRCMARMCQNVYVLSFDSIFEVVASE